ncbi:MAG TPA: translation initiation factor IF-2, partial [Sulfurovum sp.]|nr:translation initiation factor IF-2 [Sulfurovum sp.]
MDKVKIQEIADEAGLSNGDLIEKAKELGFDVKAANSTISLDAAGILVDYAISGTLPKEFKKPVKKSKITVVKKKEEAVVEDEATEVETLETPVDTEETSEEVVEEVVEEVSEEISEDVAKKVSDEVAETVIEEKAEEVATEEVVNAPAPKEIKKRKGISIASKKTDETSVTRKVDSSDTPKKRVLSRGGIKIVRKAKPAPVRAGTQISFGSTNYEPYVGKKKPKKIAEARDTGKKIDIFNHDSMSGDIDSGFGGEEVVLLDFSDKNIYEQMMRQEQKRKEEMKKREAANGGPIRGRSPFRPQQRRGLKRGGKRKKYAREENTEAVTTIEIPENVRVYEFAEQVNRKVG